MEGVISEEADQFDSPTVEPFDKAIGGFKDKRGLDLGPMEGGILYQLHHLGARKVISVEANSFLFLKCLVAIELLRLESVELLLGDFNAFMDTSDCGRSDVIYASGVMYHQREPLQFLERIAAHTDCVIMITHYYDSEVFTSDHTSSPYFSEPVSVSLGGFTGTGHRRHYKESQKSPVYCGGVQPTSVWLERDAIFGCLAYLGFDKIKIVYENAHPNGPTVGLVAQR